MFCRRCRSSNLDYRKYMYLGVGGVGRTYHYGVKCLSCSISYKLPLSPYIEKQVEGKEWIYSKKLKRSLGILPSNELKNKNQSSLF